jgi:hypothetical protein
MSSLFLSWNRRFTKPQAIVLNLGASPGPSLACTPLVLTVIYREPPDDVSDTDTDPTLPP